MKDDVDHINGKEVPQLIITDDFTILDKRIGTVRVKSGILTISGQVDGTLDVQRGSKVAIIGKQHGTVSVGSEAEVVIYGEILGTTTISNGGTVTIEEGGKLAGTLKNEGELTIRGVFGGSQSGDGKVILEGRGYIKEPVVKDGISYYKW